MSQFSVPIVISLLAFGAAAKNLPMAGWFWVPFILLAAWGAWKNMDDLTTAKSDLAGSLSALREPHPWVMALLCIGTFGSFVGFAGTFPELIADTFPQHSGFQVGTATVTLAFMGALVGSLARPCGGRLADRVGGARMTTIAFCAMAVGVLTAVLTLPTENFWVFLACFLFLFALITRGVCARRTSAMGRAGVWLPAPRTTEGPSPRLRWRALLTSGSGRDAQVLRQTT